MRCSLELEMQLLAHVARSLSTSSCFPWTTAKGDHSRLRDHGFELRVQIAGSEMAWHQTGILTRGRAQADCGVLVTVGSGFSCI